MYIKRPLYLLFYPILAASRKSAYARHLSVCYRLQHNCRKLLINYSSKQGSDLDGNSEPSPALNLHNSFRDKATARRSVRKSHLSVRQFLILFAGQIRPCAQEYMPVMLNNLLLRCRQHNSFDGLKTNLSSLEHRRRVTNRTVLCRLHFREYAKKLHDFIAFPTFFIEQCDGLQAFSLSLPFHSFDDNTNHNKEVEQIAGIGSSARIRRQYFIKS